MKASESEPRPLISADSIFMKLRRKESTAENKAFNCVYGILVINMLESTSIYRALNVWSYLKKGVSYITTRCPSTVRLKLEVFAWLKEQKLNKYLFSSALV